MSFRNAKGGYIRPGYDPLEVANPPTGAAATAGNTTASVSFTAPTNTGGSAITNYYAVSNPGQITASSVTSPISVSGLTNGTEYTFKVWGDNSYGPSAYSVPTGAVTPAPPYIEDVFSTYLYTGNDSTQTITNGIDLSGEGGLVWIKSRNAGYSHSLFDTVRGANKRLVSNGTAAESTTTDYLTSFSSTGFSLGADISVNGTGVNLASWTFRQAEKFFDVVTYTGNGASARFINHNLGSEPGFIVVKRTDSTSDWYCYHTATTGIDNYLLLNSTAAKTFSAEFWGQGSPSTTQFGISSTINVNGGTYVAYLFAHDAGGFGANGTDNVISCGSYTGNGSATGPTITLGYEPQWLLVKRASNVAQWYLIDNMRGMALTGNGNSLYPNTSQYENQYWLANFININSTGFQVVNSDTEINANGDTYIYIAIRRGPMKTPTTGTSVYEAYYNASSLANKTNGSLPSVDFAIQTQAPVPLEGYTWTVFDRLRGTNKYLVTYATSAEATDTSVSFNAGQLGVRNATWFSSGGVGYNFKRAPGFFDVVCYTGDASTTARPHNLGVAPELMIFKQRNDGAISWYVYAAPLGNTKYLILDSASGQATASFWNNQTPTSTNFYIRASGFPNEVGGNYVAYLFASCPGVSKVGSYTGNGTSQTINCGFTTGARFILIKETTLASAGNWVVWDYARGIVAGDDPYLTLNTTNSEVTNKDVVDADSTGFIVNETSGPNVNTNGSTYIFLAIS